MEHLSSCYFCGAAVETEVREYPVVTGSLDGVDLPPVDERPTVALCVPCRRKLDRVLAAGVGDADALGDGPPGSADGDAPGAPDEDDPDAPDRGDAGTADGPADDGAESGGPTPADPDADGEGVADATADLAVSGEEADEGPSIAADAEIFGDVDPVYPDEDGLEAASGGVGDPEGGGGPDGGDDPDGDAGGPAPDPEDRSFSTSQAAGGRATGGHGESESESATPDGSDDEGGDDVGADGPEVPREAYNKVVRLLQNREFPVQRGDVLAVATNAYDLRRRDCEAAIDALVERGIVDADGERLLRPDD